jgi:hypothetical protein
MRATAPFVALTLPALAALGAAAPLRAQADLDAGRAGRFDYGKMWTFESPPSAYFSETYGFTADDAWFERARGAALRLPGCSAAFVSPRGLVVTNHHCIRGEVFAAGRPGENLLEDGFYAPTLADERPLGPGFYVDQLIAVEDVSAEVLAAVAIACARPHPGRDQRAGRGRGDRRPGGAAVQRRALFGLHLPPLHRCPAGRGGGGAARLLRRRSGQFHLPALRARLRLPAHLRRGRPADPERRVLRLERGGGRGRGRGVRDRQPGGDQPPLHRRAARVPARRTAARAGARVRRAHPGDLGLPRFHAEDPAAAEALGLRNEAFSLSNSWKQYVGQIQALADPTIMARKRDAERLLRDSIAARPELRAAYGHVLDSIAALQPLNRRLAPYYNAFLLWGNPVVESATIRRAILAERIASAGARGLSPDSVASLRRALLASPDLPSGLERRFLLERLRDFATLPADDATRRAALGEESPEALTELLLARSAMGSAERTARAVEQGAPSVDDRAVRLVAGIAMHLQQQTLLQRLAAPEAELGALLGRARFEIYGTGVPPDGSSSPRITDGVVRGYSYNGTLAPPYTTFFGLYDRYRSHGGRVEWQLAERWRTPPAALDLSTPLNFVSTADTYGGNSGSPAVTRELEIVGLNFDRNIEGMTRNFIYLPESGRNIMVDVRAIREALDDVYDADRIVQEVLTHRMYATEREADAAAAAR